MTFEDLFLILICGRFFLNESFDLLSKLKWRYVLELCSYDIRVFGLTLLSSSSLVTRLYKLSSPAIFSLG